MTEASQERALGRLEAKVDLILEEQENAARSRRDQYEKLELITRKGDEADRNFTNILKRLEAVEEPVAEFSKWRERFIGMGLLVAFVAGSIGALAVSIWDNITSLLKH